jgi:type III pantothenate kinase
MTCLCLDIGNTKTAIGLFDGGDLLESWRISTRHWTSDELGLIISSMLSRVDSEPPELLSYASVVPQVRHAVEKASEDYLGARVIEVCATTAGIAVKYPRPEELGPDRIANAVATVLLGNLPAIVVDFGTATTFDVIDADGAYLGGAIAPGIGTASSELFRKAEMLNPVELELPGSALGRTTAEAVRSGVLLGSAGAADRLVELLTGSIGDGAVFIATGGWAEGIAGVCRTPFVVIPALTLMGVNEVGRRCRNGLLKSPAG